MQIQIDVENIRCGGCANSITKKLMEDERIQQVSIDIEKQCVTLAISEPAESDQLRDVAVKKLFDLGYPERGSVEGLSSLKEKAKSVVSCAIGKVG